MFLLEKRLKIEKNLEQINNLNSLFDYIKISIASPKRIKSWAERKLSNEIVIGQILSSETVNSISGKPFINGLFCERIFGPIKDYQCSCRKYFGFLFNKICDKCFVELIDSRVRKYRMAYLELGKPMAHVWYFKSNTNYLSILLSSFEKEINLNELEKIIYYKFSNNYKFWSKNLSKKKEINITSESILSFIFRQKEQNGADLLNSALQKINIFQEICKLRYILFEFKSNEIHQQIRFLIKKIRILESFFTNKNCLSWIILTTLPILPPNLRPFSILNSGNIIVDSLNEIYKLIIQRNKNLIISENQNFSSKLILNQNSLLLQNAIDLLIDSTLTTNVYLKINQKKAKSLGDILEGKEGIFRQHLLGKRVDFSGRTVICSDPSLKINECGIPFLMAKEIFEPFVLQQFLKYQKLTFLLGIKYIPVPLLWTILEEIIEKNCIYLNRAPTLHKYGIQGFKPFLTLNKNIHLHPLVCAGFNADFDGDQMAVYLPLSKKTQFELKSLTKSSFNLLSVSSGRSILIPTQEMILGLNYLTQKNLHINNKKNLFYFKFEEDVISLFYKKKINIHEPILVKYFVNNALLYINKNYIYFINNNNFFPRKLKILKSFKNFYKNFLILNTSLGIFFVKNILDNYFNLKKLLINTTSGQLIFKNIINKCI